MKRLGLWVALLAIFSNAYAAEEPIPPSPIAKTELIINAPEVTAGKMLEAGITFTLPPHWHIYWKNPGDSGIPTKFEWTLPEGLKPDRGLSYAEIDWPAPERLEMSTVVNYGYSNRITLPVRLLPMKDGITGYVKVKASWLVCRDICIPESAELSAPLKANPTAAKTITQARATLPKHFEGKASFNTTHDAVKLTLESAEPWDIDAARFSPAEDGIMANFPFGTFSLDGNILALTMPRGTEEAINTWHGVLTLTKDGKETAWDITATNSAPVVASSEKEPEAAVQAAPTPSSAPPAFIIAILLAFIGGLILNIMPCVLPILALKALALSKKAAASRSAAAKQGFTYTAGVVLSFLLIAGAMLALKATGSAIGWGFQLQNPLFVGLLAVVMLLVSANLLGFFELPVLFGEKATGVDDSKLRGSFLTGVLAVLVATPCTAPFMATAIGATLSMPTVQALAVFATLGLGMASPFLVISLWPAARRLLPKPGAWMHRFKHILAIPMLATAVWLLWVLTQILMPTPIAKTGLQEPYSATRLAELRKEKRPVFVDATAAWCLSCKVNERVAIKPVIEQGLFANFNIVWMVADWTTSDPEITKYLASFGRNGVPLYVYYPPHGEPQILPQILTPELIRTTIYPDDANLSAKQMEKIDAEPESTVEDKNIILPSGQSLEEFNKQNPKP